MERPFRNLTQSQSYFCDVLRFLAALAVAVHHSLDRVEISAYDTFSRTFHTNLGTIGVMVFFLLSGFLITHTAGRKSTQNDYGFKQYCIERVVRIYLVYLPALVLAAAVSTAFQGQSLQPDAWRVERFASNFFMVQGIAPFDPQGVSFALMGPSWTLSYEFWFYILFGLAALPKSKERAWSATAGVVIFAVAFLTMQLHHVVLMGATWLSGALAAIAFQHVRLPFFAGLAIAASSLIGAIFLRDHGWLSDPVVTTASFAIAFIALMLAFPIHPTREEKTAAKKSIAHHLAAYSYSLYITQAIWFYLALQLAKPQIMALGRETHPLMAAFIVLLAVNIGAFIFALCTEAHNESVRRWFKRAFDRPAHASAK